MLTTEIQQDTHSGPVTLNPRWLRIPAAVKYSGLSRSRLYELLSEKRIKSICVKARKGAARGVRLLDRESIDSFMLAVPIDADGQHLTLSNRYPDQVGIFDATKTLDEFSRLIQTLPASPVILVDFPAQETDFLLSAVNHFRL